MWKIPAPRSASGEPASGEPADAFDEYHRLVSAVFADHRPVTDPHDPILGDLDPVHLAGAERCSCGAAWPCTAERLAAQLLDWGV